MHRWPKRLLIQISACVAIVYGLSFLKPSFAHDRRPTYAKKAAQDLEQACNAFFEEYQSLPLANTSAKDDVQTTTGKASNIMPFLCIPTRGGEGSKYATFFNYSNTDGLSGNGGSVKLLHGLPRNIEDVELFDPWGNPYYALFDYDYNGELTHPRTGETLKEIRALIWSPGPDGKTGTPGFDEDNIYSR